MGHCCKKHLLNEEPFPGYNYPAVFGAGMPKRSIAVHDGDTDLKLGGLRVEVPRHALPGSGLPANHERVQ